MATRWTWMKTVATNWHAVVTLCVCQLSDLCVYPLSTWFISPRLPTLWCSKPSSHIRPHPTMHLGTDSEENLHIIAHIYKHFRCGSGSSYDQNCLVLGWSRGQVGFIDLLQFRKNVGRWRLGASGEIYRAILHSSGGTLPENRRFQYFCMFTEIYSICQNKDHGHVPVPF